MESRAGMIALSIMDQQRNVISRHVLSKDLTTIGREMGNDVVLQSALVSRRHLKFYCKDGIVEVEGLGVNGTFVNQKELPRNQKVKLKQGDELTVGEFTIYVGDPKDEKGDKVHIDEQLSLSLMNIERTIHDALLERLDLRTFTMEKVDDETVFQIETILENLVEEHLGAMDGETVEYVIRRALKRYLLDRILFPVPRTQVPVGRQEPEAGPWEGELERILRTISELCNLEFKKELVQQNLTHLDRTFGQVATRDRLTMSKGLQRFLVKKYLFKDIRDMVLGLGPLQELLDMPNINEIMVVSKDQIYVDKGETLEKTGHRFFSNEVIHSIVERIVNPLGRRIDKSTPLVDARLQDGSRVNVIIPPLALKGPCITIRKFSKIPLTVDDLIEFGSLSIKAANFLKGCVAGKKNILISGGTGSGKTTLLNVLSSFIGHRERIVTIEDSAELQLKQEHVVTLETRPPNIEGKGEYTIRDLVKNSLRMRPDRIIVGECRGPEALDMLQAMNTGHDGSMTTIHANTPEDVLLRLETMVLMAADIPVPAIRQQISAAVNVIVQVARFPEGNKKRTTHVTHLVGIDDKTGNIVTEDIYRYQLVRDPETGQTVGRLEATGYIPDFVADLLVKGYFNLDNFF
ncbi:MAG: Flp pilus assembly complex ATPase component TadA [Candidatus Riflebacteria bacterium]|nr:Flp pilus assembly complex ATPase component TadA [Candidatus Riflebacteria bacterium]